MEEALKQITSISKKTLLAVFIFIAPIMYAINGQDLRLFQERVFQFLGMCLIACFIGNFWLSAFLMLNVFLYFYNGAEIGGNQVLNVFVGCLIFMVSRAFFTKNSFLEYSKI